MSRGSMHHVVLCITWSTLALLNWLRKAGDVERTSCLPQPTDVPGLPSKTVKAANDCVSLEEGPPTRADRKRKRESEYYVYSASERLSIARYASDHGVARAARHFSSVLSHPGNESTVRSMQKKYLQKIKQQSGEVPLVSLPRQKRGHPLLIGDTLEHMIRNYILKLREAGGVVSVPSTCLWDHRPRKKGHAG